MTFLKLYIHIFIARSRLKQMDLEPLCTVTGKESFTFMSNESIGNETAEYLLVHK